MNQVKYFKVYHLVSFKWLRMYKNYKCIFHFSRSIQPLNWCTFTQSPCPFMHSRGQKTNSRRCEKHVWACVPWDLVKFMQFANASFLKKQNKNFFFASLEKLHMVSWRAKRADCGGEGDADIQICLLNIRQTWAPHWKIWTFQQTEQTSSNIFFSYWKEIACLYTRDIYVCLVAHLMVLQYRPHAQHVVFHAAHSHGISDVCNFLIFSDIIPRLWCQSST